MSARDNRMQRIIAACLALPHDNRLSSDEREIVRKLQEVMQLARREPFDVGKHSTNLAKVIESAAVYLGDVHDPARWRA